MSIQINHGWKITNASLDDIYNRVMAFRADIATRAQDLVANEAARRWVDRFDARIYYLHTNPDKDLAPGSLDDIWAEIREEQERSIIKRVPEPLVDCEYTMNLYQLGDHVLGISHCQQAEWRDAWLETAGAHDYGYWDNTDRSDKVDAIGWKKRKDDWHTVIDDMMGTRCDGTGLSAVIHEGRAREPRPDEVLDRMACIGTRIANRTEDIIRGREINRLCGGDATKVNSGNIFRLLREASKFMETQAGQDQMSEVSRKLRSILPREITVEMLSTGTVEAAPGAPRQA